MQESLNAALLTLKSWPPWLVLGGAAVVLGLACLLLAWLLKWLAYATAIVVFAVGYTAFCLWFWG